MGAFPYFPILFILTHPSLKVLLVPSLGVASNNGGNRETSFCSIKLYLFFSYSWLTSLNTLSLGTLVSIFSFTFTLASQMVCTYSL